MQTHFWVLGLTLQLCCNKTVRNTNVKHLRLNDKKPTAMLRIPCQKGPIRTFGALKPLVTCKTHIQSESLQQSKHGSQCSIKVISRDTAWSSQNIIFN